MMETLSNYAHRIRRCGNHRLIYYAVAFGLIFFLLLAVVHDLIPGLHVENDLSNEVICPFCKLIYTPALLVAVVMLLFIAAENRQPARAEVSLPRFLLVRRHACRAPPLCFR